MWQMNIDGVPGIESIVGAMHYFASGFFGAAE